MRKFEMRSLRIWKWEFDVSLVKSKDVRVKRENDRKEMREIKWEFAQITSSLAMILLPMEVYC